MDKYIKHRLDNLERDFQHPYLYNKNTDRILQETKGKGLYKLLEFDLSIARTDEKIIFYGDRIIIEDCPDSASIKLNDSNNSSIDLTKHDKVKAPFKAFYLTNASGSGTLKLQCGTKGLFDLVKKNESGLNESDYIIFKSGLNIKCIDGSTGATIKTDTDASTVIQYAIDKLTTGGHIVIKTGSYTLTASLDMFFSNCWVQGSGRNTVLTMGNSITNACAFRFGESGGIYADNCMVSDLQIDGNSAGNASGYGVNMSSRGRYGHVRNCFFYDIKTYAIYGQCNRPLIIGNRFHSCIGNCIVQGSYDARIIGNEITNNTAGGIRIIGQGVLVTGNMINSNSPNILVQNDLNSIISNQLDAADTYGIHLDGANRNTITANSISICELDGIKIEDSDANCINGNVVDGNSRDTADTYSGIYLTGSSHDNAITGNTCTDIVGNDQKYGLLEDGTADWNNIVANVFFNNVTGTHLTAGANTNDANNIAH